MFTRRARAVAQVPSNPCKVFIPLRVLCTAIHPNSSIRVIREIRGQFRFGCGFAVLRPFVAIPFVYFVVKSAPFVGSVRNPCPIYSKIWLTFSLLRGQKRPILGRFS